MNGTLRLGTRSSGLALAQAGHVADALRAQGAHVELVPLSTPGDRERLPLTGRGNEGIFVSSVREAPIEGSIDLAVHSFKDVPTDVGEGLVIAAVPRREDPRDTVISRGPDVFALASGARIGTCSARRAGALHLLADICAPDGTSRILVTAHTSRPDNLAHACSFGAAVGRELLRRQAFAGRVMAS